MEAEENLGQGLIPNFCDVSVVFMLVLLVELLAVVLALAPTSPAGFWDRLAMVSLYAQWLALMNAGILCATRRWLNQQPLIHNAIVSFTIMMLMSGILSGITVVFGDVTGLLRFNGRWDITFFVLRNLLLSAIIYSVVLRYFYVQLQWRLNLQAQSHAQIQALKARIRPHFLFNSMNTIASLVHIDANKAEKAVEDLSDLFRASLKEETIHTLQDEINLTTSYINIEQLRLGERLNVNMELAVDDDVLQVEVPALCLQPLVENAIYHGVEPVAEGGSIKISAQLENNRLCLCVSNPVSERDAMSLHKGNHMAQANIRTRLNLMYGDEAEFKITAATDLYSVSIGIPL